MIRHNKLLPIFLATLITLTSKEAVPAQQSKETEDQINAEQTSSPPSNETSPENLLRLAYGNYQRERHLSAFNLATQAADAGSLKAKVLLAMMFREGFATERDMTRARNLLEEASQKGDVEAMFQLALQLAQEQDQPEIKDKIFETLTRASNKGHAEARLVLATLYLDKDYQAYNPLRAAQLLSTLLFIPDAVYQLSLLYLDGSGVPLDPDRGLKLLQLAANQGVETAQIQLASMYLSGRHITRDEGKAIAWLKLASLKGNPLAQNQLARAYATAEGENFNSHEALKWHLISRAQGMSDLYLDSFIASLPQDLYEKVRKEIAPLGY